MSSQDTFLVVGAGLAGAKAAEALRAQGFTGNLTVLGTEADPPYDRPPLSKEYLQGQAARETLPVHPWNWYAEHDVTLRTSTSVTDIDRGTQQVELSSGERLAYDQLLLATGSSPRALPVSGADLDGVHYLRRVGDSDRLRDTLHTARRAVIVGGGWIGMEVAAAARLADVEVTVVESAAQPLRGVLGEEIAQVFAALHRQHGVELRLNTNLVEITGQGNRVSGVTLAGGEHLDADAVIVAVGAAPNVSLAERAGLTVDDGVVVDSGLRSSDPKICAAGDIARAYHPLLGTHIRVEHWANALNQPATAAATMLGQQAAFENLPYFFTDQYDLGMEYTGYAPPDGYDQVVVRGDTNSYEFVAFWLSQGRVLAGMNVNIWDVTDAIKALIHSGHPVDPERLADPNIALESMAQTG